jgi:hypothetical protein
MTSTECREIVIVGFAPRTKHLVYEMPEGVEIWTLNWAWKHDLPRIDRLFELHQWGALLANDETSRKHYAWLRQQQPFPVYTLPSANPDFPSAVAYPLEDVCLGLDEYLKWGGVPQRVFTSSFDYMMALAIYEGVERIRLIGVEMESETEYGYQRPGMGFWLGVAVARRIEVLLPEESKLFRPKLYHEGGQMISRQRVEAHKEAHETAQGQFLAQYNLMLGRFDVMRQKHLGGQASDEELTRARQAVLDAKAQLDIAAGALRAVELLLREFDELGVELELTELAGPALTNVDGLER